MADAATEFAPPSTQPAENAAPALPANGAEQTEPQVGEKRKVDDTDAEGTTQKEDVSAPAEKKPKADDAVEESTDAKGKGKATGPVEPEPAEDEDDEDDSDSDSGHRLLPRLRNKPPIDYAAKEAHDAAGLKHGEEDEDEEDEDANPISPDEEEGEDDEEEEEEDDDDEEK